MSLQSRAQAMLDEASAALTGLGLDVVASLDTEAIASALRGRAVVVTTHLPSIEWDTHTTGLATWQVIIATTAKPDTWSVLEAASDALHSCLWPDETAPIGYDVNGIIYPALGLTVTTEITRT